jgi:hypothetical protein
MKLIAISILWALILALGMVGLFANQPGLMGICIVAWTPLAVGFGYCVKGAGLRVSFGADRAVETVQPVQRESLLKQRERKIT